MTKALSAREAHSVKIRAALIAACEDLLVQQPIDALTITNIVKAADVAKGSFYNHFADKEALASAVAVAIIQDFQIAVEKNNDNITDPAYKMTRAVCTFMYCALSDPRRATIMLRGHDWVTSSKLQPQENSNKDIEEGIRTGRFRKRSSEVGSILILGTTSFSMIRIVQDKLSVEQTIELSINACLLILCGLGLDEKEALKIATASAKDIIRK